MLLLVPCARALRTVCAVAPVGKNRFRMHACALKNVPFLLLFLVFSLTLVALSLSLCPHAKSIRE